MDTPAGYYDQRAPDTRFLTALLTGLGAAVVGGAAWAAIVAFTGYELGIVAWGIGALVGLGMASATPLRGSRVALAAAGMALVGLVVGRVLIAMFVMGGGAVSEIVEDQRLLAQAGAFELQMHRAFPAHVQAEYDAVPEGDTLSDALWEKMVAAGAEHVRPLPEAERERVAQQYAAAVLGASSVTDKVAWQLTMYDLLWALLAVSTAWKLLAGAEQRSEQPEQVAAG